MSTETIQQLLDVYSSELGKARQIAERVEGLQRDLGQAKKNLSLSEAAVKQAEASWARSLVEGGDGVAAEENLRTARVRHQSAQDQLTAIETALEFPTNAAAHVQAASVARIRAIQLIAELERAKIPVDLGIQVRRAYALACCCGAGSFDSWLGALFGPVRIQENNEYQKEVLAGFGVDL